jgi:drug/metabolite transporter (DMT)-like permease
MSALKILGAILILAGTIALVYRSFSYTKETHEAKLGPLELSVKEKETINVPTWAGVTAIVIGGVLLLIPQKR